MSMNRESTSLKWQLLKTGKAVIQHLTEMMLFLNYSINQSKIF